MSEATNADNPANTTDRIIRQGRALVRASWPPCPDQEDR